MVKKIIYSSLLYTLFLSFAIAQSNDTINLKKQELSKVKTEISELEGELKTISAKEKESLRVLENLNRQKMLISKLITNYKRDEESKSLDIQSTENEIATVENKISLLKQKYSDYVVWIYKNKGISLLGFILNAASFNQALKRYKYLQFITEQNKKHLEQLVQNKNQLADLKSKLLQERNEKQKLVDQKTEEQNILIDKENVRKDLISTLKKDHKMIAGEIELKRRTEIMIKNLIAKLVEEERERRSRLKEKNNIARNNTPNYNYDKLENFSQLKGNLIWPVKGGKIVRKFGENKNEKLNTITLNYGIDVQVKKDADVHSVAEGIVSAIDWIPGYGSIVILTHRDEFRTVYGHVSEILVKEGDKLTQGKVIGKVNESLEGSILHFEIWSERNYQNPELWLAKK